MVDAHGTDRLDGLGLVHTESGILCTGVGSDSGSENLIRVPPFRSRLAHPYRIGLQNQWVNNTCVLHAFQRGSDVIYRIPLIVFENINVFQLLTLAWKTTNE